MAQRCADEGAVRDLIHRLAMYADGLGTCEEYAQLFTEDGEWLMPNAPRKGRSAILAGSIERRSEGGVGPGSNTRHIVASTVMEFDGPDKAIADSYWMFFADTATSPRIMMMGYYRDTLVRTSTGWKMARREIAFG